MEQLIFDIGMHTGKDTEFYLKKGFRVVAIEANPELVDQAKINFKNEIINGKLVIINKAIAPEDISEIDFYINNDKDDWGTIIPDWNSSMSTNFRLIKVPTTNLSQIIKEYGIPYYIKIDIEGADELCLKSLLDSKITIPEYISVELLSPNNLKGKKVDSLQLLCLLYALGYRKFKVSDQSLNNKLKSPNPALEGIYTDFSFGFHNSGLFGKELTSKYFSIDEISQMYLNYFYKSEINLIKLMKKVLSKSNFSVFNKGQVFHTNGWFDVHASK